MGARIVGRPTALHITSTPQIMPGHRLRSAGVHSATPQLDTVQHFDGTLEGLQKRQPTHEVIAHNGLNAQYLSREPGLFIGGLQPDTPYIVSVRQQSYDEVCLDLRTRLQNAFMHFWNAFLHFQKACVRFRNSSWTGSLFTADPPPLCYNVCSRR